MSFSSIDELLDVYSTDEGNFVAKFREHFIGNPVIRSLHGGIVGTMIEWVAEEGAKRAYTKEAAARFEITSSNINFIRVTKDADLYASYEIVRFGRRVVFVDVTCWQDEQSLLIAKGSCVVRVIAD